MNINPRILSRLDRYIITKFLGTYFFSIALIISIAVVFDYNENIDKFTTNNAPWRGILIDYYANFIPYFSNLFSPLFVFIAVIFFTSKLADNSEIIAMMATGMSRARLLRPYMISAALIALMTFLLGAYVIPRGSVTRLAFENTYKKKKKNQFAQNVQLQVQPGVIAYIEHYDGRTRTGRNFSLDRFEDKKLVSHLTAPSITYDTLADQPYRWHINNYRIRTLTGMRETITSGHKIDSIIHMEPSDFLLTRNQHETLTTPQLKQYILKQQARGAANLKPFQVERHKRIATSFASFILTIIGMSLSSQKRKGGMGIHLGVGLALSAAYILLQTISATFAINADWPPPLAAWMPNIIFAVIAYILYKKTQQ